LEFAYRAQCRCNPAGTPKYLQSVITIKLNIPPTLVPQNLALECLIAVECSRGRWPVTQIETSAELLGFGKDHDLKLEWGDEIDDEFLISAWKDSMRRAWDDPTNSKQRRNDLTVAATVLGEQRGSRKVIEELRAFKPNMDPDQAYRVLEVPKDVDEGMLLMVYQLRVRLIRRLTSLPLTILSCQVEERPQQMERMKQALLTISESRNSSRLQHYLETGVDGMPIRSASIVLRMN
jgi:ubiquitin carboxyl-terminal hydrolase 25/28